MRGRRIGYSQITNEMTTIKNVKTKPVDKDNWKDFETLFKSKGAPKYCWCMAWRMTKDELKHNNSPGRKKFIKQRVWSGTPIGLLAYVEKEPIAWCSIAPRETYQRLEVMIVWKRYGRSHASLSKGSIGIRDLLTTSSQLQKSMRRKRVRNIWKPIPLIRTHLAIDLWVLLPRLKKQILNL